MQNRELPEWSSKMQKLSVPWKFPETQSAAAGDALFSFLFGKVYAGQLVGQLAQIRDCSGCPRGVLQAVVDRWIRCLVYPT